MIGEREKEGKREINILPADSLSKYLIPTACTRLIQILESGTAPRSPLQVIGSQEFEPLCAVSQCINWKLDQKCGKDSTQAL